MEALALPVGLRPSGSGALVRDVELGAGLAGLAGLKDPVLLVPGMAATLPSETSTQLKRPKRSAIYAVGGTSVVSNSIISVLGQTAATTGLAGADRYATAVAVNARPTRPVVGLSRPPTWAGAIRGHAARGDIWRRIPEAAGRI